MTRVATVIHGPSVWVGKRGRVVVEETGEVVVELEAKDDAGHGIYEVRFPAACVKIEEEVPLLTAMP